jgi:hypothetical protein
MNLRDQLRTILPEFLPADPRDAVKGTELIRLVRLRLGEGYSDATLRYHFSILSYDPTSPIAKVDQGQGYYRRVQRNQVVNGSHGSGLFESGEAEVDGEGHRFLRASAIFERLSLLRSRYPFTLNPSKGGPLLLDGSWEVPDFVVADWDVETGDDGVERFDEGLQSLRRHLGGPEVSLSGVTLAITTTAESYAIDFFRALSASRWALQSEWVIAEAVLDEALMDALRSLGHQFGTGITALGLTPGELDELPSASELRTMSDEQFEAVQNRLRVQRITLAQRRPGIDWTAMAALRKKHDGIGAMLDWLAECLNRQQPLPSNQF